MFFFNHYPNITVIIASLFWGTYWIPLRFIENNNYNSVWPIFLSFFILSILFINPLIKSFKRLIIEKNYLFFIGCFFSALAITLYSESLIRGEIAKVVILFYLCPVWGTILSRIFLNLKFTKKRIISIILGLIGLEIIIGLQEGIFFPSSAVDWIALTAGITWAFSLTFFHLAKKTNCIEKTSLTAFLTPFLFLILCFIPEGRSFNLTNNLMSLNIIYIWILLFAFIWLLPSIFLTFFSVEILDPGRINLLLAFEVVIGITTAALLTYEVIGVKEIVGAFLVIASCFTDVINFKKK